MNINPAITKAVEQLDYRVTVGDVASQTGLNVEQSRQDLLALASVAGGHLQVAESGDIAYQFPKNFRTVLRSKFWQLRLQAWWDRIKGSLFYLVRISFGIILILSIVIVLVAIFLILMAMNSRDDDSGGGSGGMIMMPRIWLSPNWFYIFYPDYHYRRASYTSSRSYRRSGQTSDLSFLEAIYSFLFGDGDPNADLEDRRWQTIATVIRNNNGAIAAEQIAPYLDDLGEGYSIEYEDYMLPVLTRFNGKPEVSPEGNIIYYFPDLQVTATQSRKAAVPDHLEEQPWRFSQASSGQIQMAIGLGALNLVGIAVLAHLFRTQVVVYAGFIGFVYSIFGILVAYGIGYMAIPLIRYWWIQRRNRHISDRNMKRRTRAIALQQADPALRDKIEYAHRFAAETVVSTDNLAYTSEKSLLEQEAENPDRIDAEWQRRLNQSRES